MKLNGQIRQWTDKGWGYVTHYPEDGLSGSKSSTKYFLHVSNLIDPNVTLKCGDRILFTPGPARSAHEHPIATEIELASSPAAEIKAGQHTLAQPVVGVAEARDVQS